MDFKKLMESRSSSALKKAIEESEDQGFKDDRLWTYSLDKADKASAVIRFLPTSEGDILHNPDVDPSTISPWVHLHVHSFKHNGKWFIDTCPTTYGDDCPVCNYNSEQIEKTNKSFNELNDADPVKIGVRQRKRKSVYYSNILVVDDKENPKNNGKVFLFKYGFAIYSHIKSKLFPEFEEDGSVDVTSPIDGCNFNLRIYKKNDQVSYDKCTWAKSSPLVEDKDGEPDFEAMEEIWKQCLPLYKEIDTNKPDLKKLNKRFALVFGSSATKSIIHSDENKQPDTDDGDNYDPEPEDESGNEILDDDAALKKELGL